MTRSLSANVSAHNFFDGESIRKTVLSLSFFREDNRLCKSFKVTK